MHATGHRWSINTTSLAAGRFLNPHLPRRRHSMVHKHGRLILNALW